MIASGPNPKEQLVIRRMFLEEGKTLDEVQAAFRHIEPAAIEAWERSLKPAPAPAEQPAEDPPPAEEPGGEDELAGADETELQAELDREPEARRGRRRRG